MGRYVLIRCTQGVVSLTVITVVIFLITRMIGDPLLQLLPPTHTQEEYDQLAHTLGYDQPLWNQFLTFIGGVLRGDLGDSLTRSRPVLEILGERWPVTAVLAFAALAIGYVLAILVGFAAAFSRSKVLDSLTTVLATIGIAVPTFAVGIVLIVIFASVLRVVPAGGWGTLSQAYLPIATLSIWVFAGVVRLARSSMQEHTSDLHVSLAQLKGLSPAAVFFRHAVRPSLPPVVSYAAILGGTLFSGTVITETLFGIPGLGALAVEAVENRDQPLVIGVVMLSAVVFIVFNLATDIAAAVLDPRIRIHGATS